MNDLAAQSHNLRRQLENKGIRDRNVLEAIEAVPRERFIPLEARNEAYADEALGIGYQQTISQPYIVALMTEALALSGGERVLEIGTGSGYQAAVLLRLGAHVVTVERLPQLSEQAQSVLRELGDDRIEFHCGDGTLGWPAGAPYDGIIVTAAAPRVPRPLYDQLRIGGRMVIPVGDESLQDLQLIEKTAARPRVRSLCRCRFVKLIGAAGWDE